MNKHKTIISLLSLSLIVCTFAGCTENRKIDDNDMISLEFQEEVIEGKLYHPDGDDYLINDLFVVNYFGPDAVQDVWTPLRLGDKLYVSFSVDKDNYDEALGLTLFVFEHNDIYSWNLEDAALVIEPESQNDSADHIDFYDQVPTDLAEGLYTFVIMNDEMKIDSVFEYEITAFAVDCVRSPLLM